MHYLIITTLIWAFSFGLIGNVLQGLDPLLVSIARLTIALVVFLPFLRVGQFTRRELLQLAGIGAVQFGIMYIAYMSAYQYLPSHLVALFSVLTPLYVVLFHDIRQKQFHARHLLAALISVAGLAVIKAKSDVSGSIWTGFLLSQVAGIAFAFGQVAYRDWRKQREGIQDREVFGLLYAGGAATAIIASLFLVTEPAEFLDISWEQARVILYLGIVASGVGFFFWNKGAAFSSAGALAAMNNALPPTAMFVSLFVFREIEGATATDLIRLAIGAALIGVAVVIGKKGQAPKSLHAD